MSLIIAILHGDEITIDELSAYEAKKTASGYKYGAPSGMHDDTVMALAIAWQGLSSGLDWGDFDGMELNLKSRWME